MGMKRKALLLLSLGLFFLVQAGGICWPQTTERVSVGPGGIEGNNASNAPSISGNGRYVAFESFATNLVASDGNGFIDVFVHDLQTGATTRMSVDSLGNEGNRPSANSAISADGRYVAFESEADNLVAGDTAFPFGFTDIFVHDMQTRNTTRVSVDSGGGEGDGPSFNPSISGDGGYVAFDSDADLVLPDIWGVYEIFVHERQTGTTTRVSVDSAGTQGNDHSYSPSISEDGRYVAFESLSTNLVAGDGNGVIDIFVHDRNTATTTRVSVDSLGNEGNGDSNFPSISSDGRYVAFESDADNLIGVGNDTNGSTDVFVHDRDADGNGTYDEPGGVSTTRVSVDSAGLEGNGNSSASAISSDGRSVIFESDADNLIGVGNDTNGSTDVFVDDRPGGNEETSGSSSSSNSGCFIATAASDGGS